MGMLCQHEEPPCARGCSHHPFLSPRKIPQLAEAPQQPGPPSPITHPVMSPARPQHCGSTWGGDDAL